jgi:hypothetical protein
MRSAAGLLSGGCRRETERHRDQCSHRQAEPVTPSSGGLRLIASGPSHSSHEGFARRCQVDRLLHHPSRLPLTTRGFGLAAQQLPAATQGSTTFRSCAQSTPLAMSKT